MTEYTVERELWGEKIVAHCQAAAGGINVFLWGGQQPHIGGISVLSPDGRTHTISFPGHKDAVLTEQWAEAFRDVGILPAVITAGIHYDNLSRDEIVTVTHLTDDLLAQVLTFLNR